MEEAGTFSVSWVDFLMVILLGVGLWRGRKRGMSEELLDIVKWLLIVVVAGLAYEPAGRFMSQFTSLFSPLACYVAMYILLALAIVLSVSYVRRRIGEKLVGSDVFGSAEYYLGMGAGVFRYACIIFVAMAFLNARYYTPEEIQSRRYYQEENFGSSFFMTLPDLQEEVFQRSIIGRFAHQNLDVMLIRPTAGGGSADLRGENSMRSKREKSVYDIIDKK